MDQDEFAELQQCKQVIENLQQRVFKLEKINLDLEYRLEDQAKQTMSVEKECIILERRWKSHSEELGQEINKWKAAYESEQNKGERLREHLSRTERELYGILQRKYEFMRGGPVGGKNGMKTPSNPSGDTLKSNQNGGWSEETGLTPSHAQQSLESKRSKEKRILNSMTDFLGF